MSTNPRPALYLLAAAMCLCTTVGRAWAEPKIHERIVIDKIWSAVSVGFCLLTHEDRQYIAYYNAERRMVAGMRKLGEEKFTLFVLPSESELPPDDAKTTSTIQGWDSHNYITMAVDKTGHLHLSGNMHVDPLLYFRTEKPGDVTTLMQVHSMVGKDETRCTYPQFMTNTQGELLFHYRHGSSGNGVEIYNIYDTATQKWRRFLDQPLLSGQGKRNAYQRGPILGPDGAYHLLWMWRETGDVATNNNISYAKSRDLVHWENAAGQPLTLPITLESPGTIIDPVPVNGGLHNSAHQLAFDSRGRPVVTYYKHDANDHTQACIARFEDGKWRVVVLSDWKDKHIFKGGGSGPSTFGTSLTLGAIKQHGPGKLALPFDHWKAGSGMLVIDEESLAFIEVARPSAVASRIPPELNKVTSDFPGMGVRWCHDSGSSPDPASRYMLRWESLGPNRDRPRVGDLPANSELVLYRIARSSDNGTQP